VVSARVQYAATINNAVDKGIRILMCMSLSRIIDGKRRIIYHAKII